MRCKFFIILLMFSLVFSEAGKELNSEEDNGRYQLTTLAYTSKKGKVYIVETVLDTRTGKVIKRRRFYHTKYKLPYKNRYGRIVNEE